jgi:hypothetical protein
MTAKEGDVERLFHTYFPEQQSKIVDNDFYLIIRAIVIKRHHHQNTLISLYAMVHPTVIRRIRAL